MTLYKNKEFKNNVVEVICLLYILLFVYAAVSKLLDFENFQVQLGQSPLLSAFASWISWLVPTIELLIAALLLIYKFRTIGLYAAFTLMFMFTVYIFIILNYSSFVPCSCGGILEKMSWNVHMVFNIIFVLFAALAILLQNSLSTRESRQSKFTAITLMAVSLLSSTAIIIILFLFSEEVMHHENPFIRRYPQHPITLVKNVNLKFNSYYFAGKSDSRIYLGNYTDPLHITVFDTALKVKNTFKIVFDIQKIPFKRIKIIVRGSYFYLTDGTVPCIFLGKTSNWRIIKELKGSHYFTMTEPVDSASVIFRSNNGKYAAQILSSYKENRNPRIIYNDSLLQQQIDGVFDTDGMLVYDDKIKRMVYLYYYRNEFIIADQNPKLLYRGHTIDTITKAKIKVAYLKNNTERRMAAPPLLVNANLAVCQNLMFVHSKIEGRFEDRKLWQQASIIDLYDIKNKMYLLSFAVYNVKDKKLQSFIVTNTHLYALLQDELVVYKLENIIKRELKRLGEKQE